MTGPTERDIEQRLADLEADDDPTQRADAPLVHEDPEAGEWYRDEELTEGPLDKERTDPLMVLQETVVETEAGDE